MKKISILVTAVMVLVSAGVYADPGIEEVADNKTDAITGITFTEIAEAQGIKSISFAFDNAVYDAARCLSTDLPYFGSLVQYPGRDDCYATLSIPLPAGSVIKRIELFNRGSNKDNYGSFGLIIKNITTEFLSIPNKYNETYNDITEGFSTNHNFTLSTNEVLYAVIHGTYNSEITYEILGVTVYYQ